MRCGDCNKFVSQDLDEITVNSSDLDQASQTVNVNLTMTLVCTECGGELATCEIDDTADFPDDLVKHLEENEGKESEHTLEVEPGDAEGGDFYEDKPREIKRGPNAGQVKHTPMRYQKHYYTADWTSTITCSCGATFDIDAGFQESASSFEPSW